jgi:hypothetical protein
MVGFKVPPMTLTRSATMTLTRVFLAASIVGVLGAILAGAFFLVALFSHRGEFATAALIALIASQLCMATTYGVRTYLLFSSGRWTALSGGRTSREEQPRKFVTWLILTGAVTVVWIAAAGFLTWTALVPRF